MRALVQRVSEAAVTIEGNERREIGPGLVILLGVTASDGDEQARWLADKCVNLRIFSDTDGKFNLSAHDVGGELLVVSQFTLYGDCRKGRRPSFVDAAPPAHSEPLYERFVAYLRETGLPCRTGEFGADMRVDIANDGPVTLLVET